MKQSQILNNKLWIERMNTARSGLSDRFFAMYSSLTGGITTDPALMSIPLDDHLTHRGDGVFESIKCLEGSLYNVKAHLDRLERSCAGIGMATPCSQAEMEQIICDTLRAGGKRDALIRVLISRGTGNMGIDPAQCNGPELYVMIYQYKARIENGQLQPARVALSSVPIKPATMATIKTCNYLPNVLMKLEANQRGLDFVVTLDEHGHIGEGATENIAILSSDNELLMPPPERVLAGTTAKRTLELAQQLVNDGSLKAAEYRNITVEQAATAKEIVILGTTTDVTPVIEWEGNPVGNGEPGPIAKKLLHLLKHDMTPNSDTLTEVFI
jgi:branched-subunit amino acid aminotransferase/4-amino-4-deoxychorismate lyase